MKIHHLCMGFVLLGVMAMPSFAQRIDWRNIPSPSTPDTTSQMEAARKSMNDAFGQLQNTISAGEARERANWEKKKNENTQEYLDEIYSARSVKELIAKRDRLDALRYIYGAQVDQNVARNAYDARLLTLMQLETAGSR